MTRGGTTQRTYTFAIKRSSAENDARLTQTHTSINAGAAAALQWMLSLAGGFNARNGTTAAARTVLSRCWLSVESQDHAPLEHRVPTQLSADGAINWQTNTVLGEILTADGLNADTRASWLAEVTRTIAAPIRVDAVWVNRRAAFNAFVARTTDIVPADIEDFFFASGLFERERFFALEQNAKPLDAIRAIGQWLSRRAGTRAGADFGTLARIYAQVGDALSAAPAARTAAEIANALEHVATPSLTTHARNEPRTFDEWLHTPGRQRSTQKLLRTMMKTTTFSDDTLAQLRTTIAADAIQYAGHTLQSHRRAALADTFARPDILYTKMGAVVDENPTIRSSKQLRDLLETLTPHSANPQIVAYAIVDRLSGSGHKSATRNLLLAALSSDGIDDDRFARLRAAAYRDAHKCATKPTKGERAYANAALAHVADACGFSYAGKPLRDVQYRVIFDAAARRFGAAHSLACNAERARASINVDDFRAAVPLDVMTWAEDYAAQSGAIRPRSLGRWSKLVTRWTACQNGTERREALVRLQCERTREKPGNSSLFLALADEFDTDERTKTIRASAAGLNAYVAFAEARTAITKRKATMLRHIDAQISPVWVEFGASRCAVKFRPTPTGALLTLGLISDAGVIPTTFTAAGERFARDIGDHLASDGKTVARADRLGRLAVNAGAEPVTIGEMHANGSLRFKRDNNDDPLHRRWIFAYSATLVTRTPSESVAAETRTIRRTNNARGTAASRNFGHSPGIRILGINTGLRAGAACAVLETVTTAHLHAAAGRAGSPLPNPSDLSFVIRQPRSADAAPQRAPATHRYRRIGADTLPDGTPHPCPWARIEQHFIVRLPGETAGDIRKASPAELCLVENIAKQFGTTTALPANVAHLQKSALSTIRRALATNARIATATYILSKYAFGHADGSATRAATNMERIIKMATRDRELALILKRHTLTVETMPSDRIQLLVAHLTELWNSRIPALQAAVGSLRRWLLPARPSHHVGGLSLARINNLRALRSAQVAYAMRPHPLTPSARGQIERNYGTRCQQKIAKLQAERMRLLCSRVIEAALGGSRDSSADKPRPMDRLHQPVDVIVIENLRSFHPSQRRTRRSNATLMTWRHAKLTASIEQACTLHGLTLHTVSAAYTSQEDGQTGAAGIRVTHVPVETFLEAPWWQDALETARRRTAAQTATAEDRLLLRWWSRWSIESKTWLDEYEHRWTRIGQRWTHREGRETSPPALLLPDVEGPQFVSLSSTNPVSADTNAAVAIAAKALLDRDWAGAWWHVSTQHGAPVLDAVKGAACFSDIEKLDFEPTGPSIINAWRDRTTQPIGDTRWLPTRTYLATVRHTIADRLAERIDTAADQRAHIRLQAL